MLALQLRGPDMMGLGADGAFHAAVLDSVAERVARIRKRMIAIGVPVAVGSGVVTTLTFAGAFAFARSERVWAPSLWLGGVATLAGLLSTAIAAKTVAANAAASEASTPAPNAVAAETAAAEAAAVPAPAAFARAFYGA